MGVLEKATEVILEQRSAYQGPDRPICHHRPETITRRLTHLMWLPRFDLARPYQLRQIRPLGLGLVADGCPTLGYSALEHFLGDLEALRVAAPLGDALMQRYLEVWPVPAEGAFFYLDNRRKVNYSSYPIAAGKISASDRVLGATTQLFLHDADGHGLHMHSGPGDDHMTRTLAALCATFRSSDWPGQGAGHRGRPGDALGGALSGLGGHGPSGFRDHRPHADAEAGSGL